MENEFIHLIGKMGERGSLLIMCHIIVAHFVLLNKLFIDCRQRCESLTLLDNPKKDIHLYSRTFPSSSSFPLYINPDYSTHTFLLQTTQQFTESADRIFNRPDISLIISQGTPRTLLFMMLSEL